MLPAMKMTEPYSPMARARASAKPVRSAGTSAGRVTRSTTCKAGCAERCGGFLFLAIDLLQNRLHGAHDEGQADEGERDDDADRRVADLEAEEIHQRLPEPAVRRIDRGERDAGHGGGQREGQVDHGIDQPAAREAIAHQHPGNAGDRRRR